MCDMYKSNICEVISGNVQYSYINISAKVSSPAIGFAFIEKTKTTNFGNKVLEKTTLTKWLSQMFQPNAN